MSSLSSNIAFTFSSSPILFYKKTYDINSFLPCDGIDFTSFLCPLCKGIVNNPIQDSNGHLFCTDCFDTYSLDNTTCPITGESLTPYFPANAVMQLLNNQLIYCINKERGCLWTDKLQMLSEHLKVCNKQIVPCIYEGCKSEITRDELSQHIERCGFKKEKCVSCGEDVYLMQESVHKRNCKKKKKMCPNCKEYVLFEEFEEHILYKCGKNKIMCPFVEVGCKKMVFRDCIDEHMKKEEGEHMIMFLECVNKIKGNIMVEIKQRVNEEFNKKYIYDAISKLVDVQLNKLKEYSYSNDEDNISHKNISNNNCVHETNDINVLLSSLSSSSSSSSFSD